MTADTVEMNVDTPLIQIIVKMKTFSPEESIFPAIDSIQCVFPVRVSADKSANPLPEEVPNEGHDPPLDTPEHSTKDHNIVGGGKHVEHHILYVTVTTTVWSSAGDNFDSYSTERHDLLVGMGMSSTVSSYQTG